MPRDHPRIRGEHPPCEKPMPALFRIIPAYAGSTQTLKNPFASIMGSSPHTRGAPPVAIPS